MFDKKIGDLIKFNNLANVVSLSDCVVFVKIKNNLREIDSGYRKCCSSNRINTNKPIGR